MSGNANANAQMKAQSLVDQIKQVAVARGYPQGCCLYKNAQGVLVMSQMDMYTCTAYHGKWTQGDCPPTVADPELPRFADEDLDELERILERAVNQVV